MVRACTPPKKSPCPELSMLPKAQAEHHNIYPHGNELADTKPSSTSSLLDQGSSSICQRKTPKLLSSSLVSELPGLLGTLLRNLSHMEQRHTSLLPNTCRGMLRLVSPLPLLLLTSVFDSTDKQGGFIGAMYLGGTNVAVELVREGLASVHSFSADGLPFGRELASAEEEAKAAKKNVSPSCGSIYNAHSSFGPTTPAKKSRSRRMILLLLRRSISMSTFLL
jgi:hypothetical protein